MTAPSEGHETRYRLAAGYIEPGESVLDAACGSGYGATYVSHAGEWTGVDLLPDFDEGLYGRRIVADLCTWQPDVPYDVALSFETIEHVTDPGAVIDLLCRARRLVICSVPIIATAGANPLHLHDFDLFSLPREFEARAWRLRQFLIQPSELSGIYVFGR